MAIEVREATASDVQVFRSLRLASLEFAPDSYRRLYADEVEVPLDRWDAFLTRNADDPDDAVLLASIDGAVGGMTFVGVNPETETMSLGGMWVDLDHRRKGLARALVVAATEWGCDRSARMARLAVTVTNEAAERLYLECEFVPTGETEPLREGSDVTVAWMERTLLG